MGGREESHLDPGSLALAARQWAILIHVCLPLSHVIILVVLILRFFLLLVVVVLGLLLLLLVAYQPIGLVLLTILVFLGAQDLIVPEFIALGTSLACGS